MALPAFNYPLMELLCKELNERTANAQVLHCFPNDLRRFYLVLKGNHSQEALFFCFAPPFLRFHLTTFPPARHPDSFHPLNVFLQNAILKESALLQQDRILQLKFQTPEGEYRFIGEFFPKHPNYHLIRADGTFLFSLHRLDQTHYQLPPKQAHASPQTAIWPSHREVEQGYSKLEKEWEFSKEKKALQMEAAQEVKKLRKKEKALLENLQQCSRWADVQHEGDLIKSQLFLIKKGATTSAVHDWLSDRQIILTLDPTKTPQEEMAARFHKAKKLQAGIAPLQRFLAKVQDELRQLEHKEKQIDQAASAEELSLLKGKAPLQPAGKCSKKAPGTASPIFREYLSAGGLKIWVGKNAKANDRLTFQLANGRDWWLHIRGCPGSHVVIRMSKDQEPDPETLKDAMQLALYFSKARATGEGEVCVTQRKYVSKLGKGKAGQAQISKHQSIWVKLDLERIQALRNG